MEANYRRPVNCSRTCFVTKQWYVTEVQLRAGEAKLKSISVNLDSRQEKGLPVLTDLLDRPLGCQCEAGTKRSAAAI